MRNPAREPSDVSALLQEHSVELRGFLLAAVRSLPDAEDLFQEVALAVSRSRYTFEPGTNFRAWMYEIARRRILESTRKSRRFPEPLNPEVLVKLEEASADDSDSGEREALRGCLEELTGPPRQALDFRYGEGRNPSTIARLMERSVQGVYSLLKRARQILRECAKRKLMRNPR